jgi:hypothetical protein
LRIAMNAHMSTHAHDMRRWDEMDLMLNPSRLPCARCGGTAYGYATIEGQRYCHPSNPKRPDCYTLQLRYATKKDC